MIFLTTIIIFEIFNLLVILTVANFLAKMAIVVREIRDQVDDLHAKAYGADLVPPERVGGLDEVKTPQQTYDPRFVEPIRP
jgi:hypothetical protein